MQAFGAFVPTTLVKHTVKLRRPILKPADEWASPDEPEFTGEIVDDTMDVFVRKRASSEFLEMVQATDRDRAMVAILRCVRNEDGSQVFQSIEQVSRLAEWLFIPIVEAVNRTNEFRPKNSAPRTNYGTSSPSSSAARSRKRKSASPRKNARAGSPTAPSAAR